jgi:hypothetical protein
MHPPSPPPSSQTPIPLPHQARPTNLHQRHSHLLHITPHQLIVQAREIADLDPLRSHEDAAFRPAGKVPLYLLGGLVDDAAVVLARGFVERDADPGSCAAGDLGDGADVGYGAAAGVGAAGQELAAGVEGDSWG